MAIQHFESRAGRSVSEGIQGMLQGLVDMKLQKMQEEQRIKNLKEVLSPLVSPEKANLYATLGAEDPSILENLLQLEMEAPQRQAYEDIISGRPVAQEMEAIGVEAPQIDVAPTEALQRLPKTPTQLFAERIGVTPRREEIEAVDIEPIMPTRVKEKPAEKVNEVNRLQADINRMRSAMSRGILAPKDFDKVANLLAKKEETLSKKIISEKKEEAAQKRFEKKIKLDEDRMDLAREKFREEQAARGRKETIEKQDKIDKEYKPELKQWGKKAEAALVDRARFKEMKRMNEEGDLGSNAFNIFVDALEHGLFGLGVNLTSLQTADAQAMKKLSKDFVKNVKEIIGTSRITQSEVMLYLSTIPNLIQSPEGRDRIINTNLALGKLAVQKYDVARDIINKNKGNIPKNFDMKVHERMRPKLEEFERRILNIARKAKENMKVQERQKKHFTLQDIAEYGSRNLRSAAPVEEGMTPARSPGIRGYLEDIIAYGSRNI